jgi:hypothetical protein
VVRAGKVDSTELGRVSFNPRGTAGRTFIRFSSPFSSDSPFRSWRILLEDLCVKMWFLKAFLRRIFPVAVLRKTLGGAAIRFHFRHVGFPGSALLDLLCWSTFSQHEPAASGALYLMPQTRQR